jgi:hypothetical protein
MMNLLTATRIRQAKPAEKAYKLFDGGGLFLLVTPQGQKWWRFKYRFAAKEKLLSLGVYPGIGLKQARERRDDARKQIGSGIDPSTERHAVKASQTAAERSEQDSFEAVAREWFEKFSPNWVPEHAVTVIHRLEADVLPWIGKKPIAEQPSSFSKCCDASRLAAPSRPLIASSSVGKSSDMRSQPDEHRGTRARICAARCRQSVSAPSAR